MAGSGTGTSSALLMVSVLTPLSVDPEAAGIGRRNLADLRRPALGTARPKPASQDVVLNVSKVASNSSAGTPALGQKRSLVNRSEFPLLARLG